MANNELRGGLKWSAIEVMSNRGLGFVFQILLARLVDPPEFGLIVIVSVFLLFASILVEAGFGQALVQKETIDSNDISTVFIFNILIAAGIYGLIFLAAPWIADFYREPRLVRILRIIALNIPIQSLGIVHRNLLSRKMLFKKLFVISSPSLLVSGIVGVTFALLDFQVWSLVIMKLTFEILIVISLWSRLPKTYWPGLHFDNQSFKSMFRYGSGLLTSRLIFETVQNSYAVLIGRQFNMGQLAFYNRARSFHQVPAVSISSLVSRVLFPAFSRIQNDDKKIVEVLRSGLPKLCCLLFPAMIWLMIASEEIIVLLLTEKWLPSATYMHWFPIVGMVTPIVAIQRSVLRAKGLSWLLFRLTLLNNASALLMLAITVWYGILAIVIGQVAVALFNLFVINLRCFHITFGYRSSQQFADIIPCVILAAIAGGFAWGTIEMTNISSPLVRLILKSMVLLLGYTLISARFRSLAKELAGRAFQPKPKTK